MKRSPIGKLIEAAERFIDVADLGPSTEAYDDALRKLHAAIKAASETPEDWRPIETAPKDCWVLGWAVDSTVPCAMMWGEITERWLDIHFDPWEDPPPSHWMPLPEPPAGGPKEGK